ncbi:MAG: hypothetical protein AAF408_00685 [Pseudomonadota bacterium]
MQFNLPDRIEEASFYVQTPFEIFEIDNFLDDQSYKALSLDVSQRHEFDHTFRSKGNKRKYSVGGHNIDELPASPWKEFCTFFLSQSFFEWFVKTHLSRFQKTGSLFYVPRTDDEHFAALQKNHEENGIDATYYHGEIHYSSIAKGGFIPPHTDHRKKRLSFVFYTPVDPVPEEMKTALGTVFYAAKPGHTQWRKLASGLLDGDQTRAFKSDHERVRTSRFTMNRCVGFIKNDISWHAVEPNPFDYDRRAIVVNILEV